LVCWGANSENQAPSLVTGPFTQVSAGYDHTCALRSDGTLECWGNNNYGKSIPPAGAFEQVSTGSHHACAIGIDGDIACWGSDDYGQSTPP
jgi:alpha-tubulin suppressor-like RCC1 family protein